MACFVRDHVNMHGVEKRIVYILRSQTDPFRHYIGLTNDMHNRLHWHNHGPSGHTADHRPCRWAIEFPSEAEAVRFEKYLESGSGRAFTKRRCAARHDA